jgi:cation transport regulator
MQPDRISAQTFGMFREGLAMPYATNDELPASVQAHLPLHAQDIFRSAFNNAWVTYAAHAPSRIEEIAHRVAWAAVKRRYHKVGTEWLPVGRNTP